MISSLLITNGTRLSSVPSAALFSVYPDDLDDLGVGCHLVKMSYHALSMPTTLHTSYTSYVQWATMPPLREPLLLTAR